MNHTASVFILFPIIVGVLVFGIWSNTFAYAQQASSPSLSGSHVSKIKIKSPIKGQQVSVGKDLTISGTSIDNATSNDCKVSVIVNKVRPYQNATAAGTGGAVDYSKWNFVLTSKYTTIKPGQNRITAKYDCAIDPNTTSFSNVNVTGLQSTGATASSTKPTTIAAAAAPSLKKQQQMSTTNAISPSAGYVTWATVGSLRKASETSLSSSALSSIAPQVKAINQQQAAPPPLHPSIKPINTTTAVNNTAGQNYTFAAATAPSSMPTSDQMLYLGYHGNSDSKYNDHRDSSTRSVSDSTLKPKDTKPHATPRVKIIPPDAGIKKTSTTSLGGAGAGDDTTQSFQHTTGSISDSSSLTSTTISPIKDYGTSEDKSSSHGSLTYNGFASKKKTTNSIDGTSSSGSDTSQSLAHITKKRTGISDFTIKKKTSTAKLDTHSTNEDKSSSHTDGVANIENNSGGHSIFGFSDG
jgi:hypothetical protein